MGGLFILRVFAKIKYIPSTRCSPQRQTYIHNWPIQPFSQDYIVSGRNYSLTSTPNDRFLRNFLMAGLFTLRVFARNLLRGSR